VSILVRDDGINPRPDLFNPAIHRDEAHALPFFGKDRIRFGYKGNDIMSN